MNSRAARTQTGTLASNFTVSTGAVTIFGFIIANSSNTNDVEVTWTNNAGTVLGFATVGVHDTFESKIEWIADAGLIFTSAASADIHITVFHSQAGA